MLIVRGVKKKDNFIQMDNKSIFIGINEDNLNEISDRVPTMNNHKIHIFAYKLSDAKYIKEFVNICDVSGKYRPKIIIHIPSSIKELKGYIDERLVGCREYTILIEKGNVMFSNYWVDDFKVEFSNGKMQTWFNPHLRFYSSYDEYKIGQDTKHPSVTFEVLLKKELIKAFRESCSKDMLEQIGDSNEKIWEFIEKQNWRVNIDNK